jgi:hypothetical protein
MMSKRKSTKPVKARSDTVAAIWKQSILRFIASGELILATNTTCPISLQAASLKGRPCLVELTARTDMGDMGDIALRMGVGFSNGEVKLRVCDREFCARVVRQVENSPILWLDPSDVFVGLFPKEPTS